MNALVLMLSLASAEPILVAAASDLQGAFSELGKQFEADGHGKVSFTFGSTGLLSKQLKEGAPFDLLAAANIAYVDDVIKAGACDANTKAPYARGRIVVWSKHPVATLEDLLKVKTIAIANPEHAPYGLAAKEALTSAKLWDRVSPKLVLGENIRQTLQLADTGNADVAIVALSLVIGSQSGKWFLVDDKLHKPLDQALAVCVNGKNRKGAEAFAAYVASPKGREIMKRYGFELP
jgi:molybdate transport system substrate-binding protein